MQRIVSLAATLVLGIFVISTSLHAADTKNIPVRVIMPTGLPAISMAGMIKGGELDSPGYDIEYEVLTAPSLMAGKLVAGEADLAVVSTNLAIRLYNKGIKVKYAGGVVWGTLYLITQEDVTDWQDLKGKEIYTLGRGLTPDIILRYLLTQNGLDPEKDVTLNYVSGTSELAPAFIAGKSKTSIIPEPALSMVMSKKPDTRIAIDLQQEWAKANNKSKSYPQASLIVMGDFADRHPDFVRQFTAAYGKAVAGLNNDPARGGKLASTYLDMPSASIIAKSIPRSNLKWVPAAEARKPLETYFSVLFDFSAKTIGGKMPDENFYLKK